MEIILYRLTLKRRKKNKKSMIIIIPLILLCVSEREDCAGKRGTCRRGVRTRAKKGEGIIFILERNLFLLQDFFHEGGFKKQMWEEMWGGENS